MHKGLRAALTSVLSSFAGVKGARCEAADGEQSRYRVSGTDVAIACGAGICTRRIWERILREEKRGYSKHL